MESATAFSAAASPRQVREKIESSGRDARWEFNKGSLFGRSSYMAEVAGQLSEMVEVVDAFFKFLGPELKAVTGACRGRAVRAENCRACAGCGHHRVACASPQLQLADARAQRVQPTCVHAFSWCVRCCASAAVRLLLRAGDTKGIDDVIERVQAMVEPLEGAVFDVFDAAHAPQWRALRARFGADNEDVKAATRELIDTSFRKLRSAEGAFELLQVRSC